MDDERKQLHATFAYEKAMRYELDYGCCPQCVLAAIRRSWHRR